ncbi:MAG: glucan biosynthesis glucosyltransferase H, partial [Methylovirgula sp.]
MDPLINSWPPEGAAKGASEPRAGVVHDLGAAMPPESPLPMPTQNLFRFDATKNQHRVAAQPGFWCLLARFLVFGGGLALTAYGAYEMYEVVDIGGITILEWILVGLFVANFSWIALAFASACVGFFWLLFAPP